MGETFLWWLTIQVLGLAALPIAAVLMRGVSDRGYTAAKPLGLLLVTWLAFTFSMTGAVPFGRALLFGCLLLVALLSAWLLLRNNRALLWELRVHFRTRSFLRHLLAAEVLFAALFIFWAWMRSFYPDIIDQEKFMDFGILNSILRSGSLPPPDMWLAGHSLNYYYFGYILMAAMSSLSGVAPAISFNLANVFLFATTGLLTYGVVYNLIVGTILRRSGRPAPVVATTPPPPAPPARGSGRRSTRPAPSPAQPLPTRQAQTRQFALAGAWPGSYATVVDEEVAAAPLPSRRPRAGAQREEVALVETVEAGEGTDDPTRRVPFFLSPILYGVLAALMVVAMGNLAVPFAKKDAPGGQANGNGWRFCFFCEKQGYGYWWDPSRIIMDYRTEQQPDGTLLKSQVGFETINEFPAFSFVLADMHPHAMGLPFVLLAVLAAYALGRRKVARSNRWRDGLPRGLGGWLGFLLSALIVGALYTINTWDYPTYLLVMLGGLALPYIAAGHKGEGGGWRWARPFIVHAVLLIVVSLLVYLPFHLTFKSFAGGGPVSLPENVANIPVLGGLLQRLSGLFLLNTADKTITGFMVIFGIFLMSLVVWVIYEFATYMRKRARTNDEGVNTLLIFGILLMAILLIAVWTRFPLFAFLLPLIIMAGYLIWQEPRRTERNLALGIFLIAATIGLGVEIVYLHDNFGNRMNTLFKFYYQMWVLWSLAGAYGFWRTLQAAFGKNRLMSSGRGRERVEWAVNDTPGGLKVLAGTWAAAFLLLVLSALPYAWFGSQQRNMVDNKAPVGLDGMDALRRRNPGDYEAVKWLNDNAGPRDVVLECCRNEYDWPGRISAYTGLGTLVAWDTSHEKLWRSSQAELSSEVDRRRQVVNAIYQGTDPDNGARLTPQRLLDLLNSYGVDYVVVGAIERGVVGPRTAEISAAERITPYAENVMKVALPKVFGSSDGNAVIYGVQGAKVDPNAVVPTPLPEGQQVDPNAPPQALFDRAGPGANRGQFNLPRAIALDAEGNFYVSDTENKRIQKFDPSGKWLLAFGAKGSADGQFAEISEGSVGTGPGGLAVDKTGNIYVADTWNHRIQKFDSEGHFLKTWGSFISLADPALANAPDKDSRFYGPRGVAIGPDGNVYVTDTGNKRVLIFSPDGAFVSKIDSGMSPTRVAPAYAFNQPGELNEPIGIAVDAQGNVYVADTGNRRIQKFDPSGKPIAQWPVPSPNWDPGPYLEPFLAIDAQGNLYATAPTGKAVLKFDASGQVAATKNTKGAVTLNLPTGLALGPAGNVYVVDTNGNSVVDLGTVP
ncbi:MAG: hypothetical protein QOH93_2066 [Chloroflexia bacterium]|jgi:YYY domain-containing protein|nr:hypothetical protein [Chloroflexia bacterium]